MKILRSLDDLSNYLKSVDCTVGCLADTGFLYGLAYSDDRLFDTASDIQDMISEFKIPIYANVISRMEANLLRLMKAVLKKLERTSVMTMAKTTGWIFAQNM